VQKFTISPTSPRILTQVGAIRKQLQAEYLFDDDDDDDEVDVDVDVDNKNNIS